MTKDRKLAIIHIFQTLTAEELREIEKKCTWLSYPPDAQIIDFMDDNRSVYFVTDGIVKIAIFSTSGQEIIFDELAAGSLFGELAAIDGNPRSATVTTITQTSVAKMTADAFQEILRTHHSVSQLLMRRMTSIIRSSVGRIMDLSTLGANNRIYADLLRRAKVSSHDKNKAAISPIPAHHEIASRVSTTRETVARAISKMIRKNLIKKVGGRLEITNITHLREMVEDFREI